MWQKSLYFSLDAVRCVVALVSSAYLQSVVCQEEFHISIYRSQTQVHCQRDCREIQCYPLYQHSFIVMISENVLKDYEIIILEYQSIIHMFNHTVHVSSSRGLLCYNTVNSFCCFTATGLPFDSGLYRGHSLCTLCLWTTPVSRLSGQPV